MRSFPVETGTAGDGGEAEGRQIALCSGALTWYHTAACGGSGSGKSSRVQKGIWKTDQLRIPAQPVPYHLEVVKSLHGRVFPLCPQLSTRETCRMQDLEKLNHVGKPVVFCAEWCLS